MVALDMYVIHFDMYGGPRHVCHTFRHVWWPSTCMSYISTCMVALDMYVIHFDMYGGPVIKPWGVGQQWIPRGCPDLSSPPHIPPRMARTVQASRPISEKWAIEHSVPLKCGRKFDPSKCKKKKSKNAKKKCKKVLLPKKFTDIPHMLHF